MKQLKVCDLQPLLVEPSPTQQRIILAQMESLGILEFAHASNGAEALDVLANAPIDLVISALYLPDMTGTDLVHYMREHEHTHATPFMLISSETDYRTLDPIRQAGSIAILPKPFDMEQLHSALFTTVELLEPEILHLDDDVLAEDLQVLVVDDSAMARSHIQRVLSGMGIQNFEQAQNGCEALEKLQLHDFDLIVTDYNMPDMDGKELVAAVRTDPEHAAIPILMVTSEENQSRLAAVQRVGVSAMCDKPFEPKTVKSLVEKILQHAK